jgi:hypothetical protein
MTNTLTTSALLKTALTEDELRGFQESESESWYFCFQANNGHWIFVESTASQTMEGLLPLKVDAQTRVFQAIAAAIPEPGDFIVIENDRDGGKRRTAFITRLKSTQSDDRDVYLLITR